MPDAAHKQAICQRARVLLDLGRPTEALREIGRALASNPNDPECLEIEGLCHLRLGAHAEALRVFARAAAEGPARPHPHYLYGFTLREAGRGREGVAPLEAALRLAPDEPVYLRALAELFSDLGEPAKALALARHATEVAPERAANHVTLGYVSSAAGDKEAARAAYQRAVHLDPNDSAAWNNLGCLDLGAGNRLRARARFREALRLDPRGERARRNLALVAGEAPAPPRDWDDVLEWIAVELVRAKVGNDVLAALVLEAPGAMRGLVRGRSAPGLALSGAGLMVALRALGPVAAVPISVGAALTATLLLRLRRTLPLERDRVRRILAAARDEYERLWRTWLDGTLPRTARDQAVQALMERTVLAMGDRE